MPPNFTCPACGGSKHITDEEYGDPANLRCLDENDIGCEWSGPQPVQMIVTITPADCGGFIAQLPRLGLIGEGDTLYAALMMLAEAVDAAIGPSDPRDAAEIEISYTQSQLSDSIVRLVRLEAMDAPPVIMQNEVRLINERIAKLGRLKQSVAGFSIDSTQ